MYERKCMYDRTHISTPYHAPVVENYLVDRDFVLRVTWLVDTWCLQRPWLTRYCDWLLSSLRLSRVTNENSKRFDALNSETVFIIYVLGVRTSIVERKMLECIAITLEYCTNIKDYVFLKTRYIGGMIIRRPLFSLPILMIQWFSFSIWRKRRNTNEFHQS